jgi:DNA-binding transcriptional ArsR family regulator
MNEDWKSLTEVDKLVHEPSRLMILTILNSVEKADFVYLQRETGLTRGNLSVHLTRLNEAGYIDIQKTFNGKIPQTICQITLIGKKAFVKYTEYLKKVVSTISTSG